jgi:hypothetical protein
VSDGANMKLTGMNRRVLLSIQFTAGVHIGAWRICLVGIVLGVGVPAIAWLEQSALLLLLVVVVFVAVIAPFFWHGKWEGKHQPLPSG